MIAETNTKRLGCCTTCDTELFEATARWEGEKHLPAERRHLAGQMKQVGEAHEDAIRVTFLLFSGEMVDLSFCRECYDELDEDDYHGLFNKVLRSWAEELGEARPQWFNTQLLNAIMCEIGAKQWREVLANGN